MEGGTEASREAGKVGRSERGNKRRQERTQEVGGTSTCCKTY